MKQKYLSFKSFMPGIAWFFIVGVLVFMPGNDMPEPGWLDFPQFDKLVHAGMFGLLTFLFCLPYCKSQYTMTQKQNACLRVALAAIIWGIAVEFIQKFFVPGRSFEIADWIADSVGVLAGWWLSRKIIRIRHTQSIRHHERNQAASSR